MPYIPLRNGQSVFIENQEEANRRYQEEWGQASPAAPKATAKPEQKPVKQKSASGFVKDVLGKLDSYARATNPIYNTVRTVADIKVPTVEGQKEKTTTLGQEAPRVARDAVRKIVNDPIAAGEMASAVTQDGAKMSLLGNMTTGNLQRDKEEELKKAKQAEAALDALQRTGKDPQGFSYGIKPSTPIIGPLFSDDSEFVEKEVKPKSAVGRFSSAVLSSVGFDAGVTRLIKAPRLVNATVQTAPGIRQIIKDRNIQQGLKSGVSFVLKDLVPEAIQDAVFFMPEAPAALQAELKKVRELQTEEQRIAAMQALMANTDEEFNFSMELLKNTAEGTAAIIGLRGLFKAANIALKKINSGTTTQKAIDEAVQEITPEARVEIETEAVNKANVVLEENIGNVTARLHNKIDENVANVAFGMRAGAESYLKKQKEFTPNLQRLDKELADIPDVTADLETVAKQSELLKKKLSVGTTEEIAAKRDLIQARLNAYETEMRLDPEWIKKSTGTGKRRSKNATKLRKVTEAARELQELQALELKVRQLENVQLQRAGKAAEIEKAALGVVTDTVPFTNALNDARILINALDELDAERAGYLEAKNAQLFRENRLDEIDTNYNLPGPFGEAYRQLKDILNAAEQASVSRNLNPEFVQTVIKQVDEIHNKVIDNGGLAPIYPELPPGLLEDTEAAVPQQIREQLSGEASEAMLEPKAAAPVENVFPVTKTDQGEVVVDTDELQQRRALAESAPGTDVGISAEEAIAQTKRELGISQDPAETIQTLEEFSQQEADKLAEWTRIYEKTGSEDAADAALKIFNTNARKYVTDFENAPAVAAVFESIKRKKILPAQYAKAIRTLSSFIGDGNTELRMAAAFIESGKFGKDIQDNLNKIMVPVATLDSNAAKTLAAARDFRKILRGEEVEGLDRATALEEFATQFKLFTLNASALNELFYGVGNALRQFSKAARLRFDVRDPKVLFDELNKQLASMGNVDEFTSSLSKEAQNSRVEFDQRIGQFFEKVKKGEDLTEEELNGMEALIEKVYEANGDLDKLNALTVTSDSVLANLQIGSPLSNPATVASIPIQGIPETALEITGQAVSGQITGRMAKWLGKSEFAKETLDQARLSQETLLQLRFAIGEALDATYNRFVYGKAITDPAQAASNAYELRRSGGLRREEAISQDLAAKQVKIPFMNYVMERSEDNEQLFDVINKTRVFTKVFHDYFMPGEAWDKRGPIGKYILGGTTTALRKVGVGKKSYYPSGENVNLTIFGQLSATADELSTALFANASARARVNIEVDEMISQGIIKAEQRGEEITKRLNKEVSEMYQPIKVGFDQKTVGYSVLDNQILQTTRAVNLTEELTGPLKNVEEAVNKLRKSENQTLALFGRDVFPFLVSPINGIKRAVMISYGGEMAQAATDVARLGVKALPEQVLDRLPSDWRKNIIDFESKYFSNDPAVRNRAQGALALSVGINAMAWFLVRDGNQDIVGGLENTYRETTGVRDSYTIKVGNLMIPYRYLPLLGNTLALQANIRDLQEFAPGKDTSSLIALGVASLASTILEVPALAGFERINKALQSASQGDATRFQKILAESVAKVGDPYLNLRKVVTQGFDPRKPASPGTRYSAKGFYEQGKTIGETQENLFNNLLDTSLGTFGMAAEYTGVGALADAFASTISGDPGFREASRKALWYGKPGETVNANHAGKWYPVQAVLGRYWAFPDKLEDDVVAKEMVYNLISPPRTTLFQSDGVTINDSILNRFNHFLNSDFEYYHIANGKTYKGIHGYLKDLIESDLYQSYPSVDSPFKQTSMFGVQVGKGANWDRDNSMRKVILKGEVDRLISIAKEQFLAGELPSGETPQYQAPDDLKQLIKQKRLTGE